MKVNVGELRAALNKRKQGTDQAPGPAKRARREGSPGAAATPGGSRAPPPMKAPVEGRPAEQVLAPAGTGVEEGEIPAATEIPVAVINLEEEEPSAAPPAAATPAAAKGGSTVVKKKEPIARGPKMKEATPATGEGSLAAKGPAGEGPSAGAPAAEGKGNEPSGPAESWWRRTIRRRTEGARSGTARQGPRLQVLEDAVEAAIALARVQSPEITKEMQAMSFGSLMDGITVAINQAAHYTLGLKDAVSQTSLALIKARAKADRYRKEGEDHRQSLERLCGSSRAREEQLSGQLKEAEGRAEAGNRRAFAAEAGLEQALEELRAAEKQVEASSRSAAERVAAAEKAAAEAVLERAGAVACAEEASARTQEAWEKMSEAEAKANEAETKAVEAEARAKEAEARTQKAEEETQAATARAVEEFKASAEFRQEVVEGSLDAYVQGFQLCKKKVSATLKINMSELEGIRPDGEESGEDEAEGTEGKPGPVEP